MQVVNFDVFFAILKGGLGKDQKQLELQAAKILANAMRSRTKIKMLQGTCFCCSSKQFW